MREVLLQYGVDTDIVPHWLPEGFSLVGNILVQDPYATGEVEFFAYYGSNTDSLAISITKYSSSMQKPIYEKIPGSPNIYSSNEIEHYIIKNTSSLTAVWYIGNLECSINTTLPQKELEKIIDSIYFYERSA